MSIPDDLEIPPDPQEQELFRLLAASREAYLNGRPLPSVEHLNAIVRRRWERLCALSFALDQVGRQVNPASTQLDADDSRTPFTSRWERKRPHDFTTDFAPLPVGTMAGTREGDDASPAQVGRYRVLGERGRGGMGVVSEAFDPDLRRRVAIKRIHPARAADPRSRARFSAEAQLLARLGHPNIVQVYEVGEFAGLPFLVMEYVSGPNLREWLNGLPVEPRQAARLVADLARAVEHAHRAGVLHRDLKPSNVLLQTGRDDPALAGYLLRTSQARGEFLPKISDFGLATLRDQESGMTQTGELLGTPGYMAPEMAAASGNSSGPALDVYGLGTILYEALTGHPPFVGVDPVLVLSQVRFLDPVNPRQLQPEVPRDLETICLACLHKDPRRRYASALDLADDLRRFQDGWPIRARRPALPERAWVWARRRPALAAALGLACGAAVLVAVLLLWTTRQAIRHAEELESALEAANRSEQSALTAEDVARQAETRARAGKAEAIAARRRSDLLAAELKFSGALALANDGNVDRALFEMVQALRLAPDGVAHEPFRRAVRINLAAWIEQTARQRFAFRLPGKMPAGPFGENDVHLRRGYISAPDSTGTFVTAGPDRQVRQWSFSSGKAVGRPFRVDAEGLNRLPFSVSPDGHWLTTCGPEARVFDLARGVACPGTIRHPSASRPSEYTYLMFTSEPSVLASTSSFAEDAGRFCFYDAKTKRKLPVEIHLRNGDCYRVARGGNDKGTGQPLVLVSRAGQGTPSLPHLEVWELSSGKKLSPPVRLAAGLTAGPTASHPGSFVCLLRPESVRGASPLHWDGPICRWDLETGRLAATSWQPPVSAWYRFLAANDSVLVTHCRDGRIRLFDLDAGRQLGGHVSVPNLHSPGPMSIGLAVPADGSSLATVSHDGTVRCWDIRHLVAQSGRARRQSPSHFPADAKPQAAAGAEVAALSGGRVTRAFFARGNAGRLLALDDAKPQAPTGGGVPIAKRVGGPGGNDIEHDNLNGAVFSPDGTYLATATLGSARAVPPVVRLWNAADGKFHFYFRSPRYINGLRFSPDSRLLALACVGGTVVIDIQLRKVRHILKEATCAVNLSFSPDGRRLAVGYRGGWAGVGAGYRLWDLETGQPVGPFRPSWSWWSAAQPLGYAAGGDMLVVLDPDGRKVTRLDLRNEKASGGNERGLEVQSPSKLAVTPASPLVVLTGTSGAIELWNARTGRRQRSIPSGCEVQNLHLSPDGRVLAAVCSDKTVRLWDMETGFPLGPPRFHSSGVAALAFRAGHGEVVVATQAGRLYRWPLPEPMKGSAEACERRLAARLGLTFASGDAVLLSPEAWRQMAR